MLRHAAGRLEKLAKDRNWFQKHEDASSWHMPIEAASASIFEVGAPYVRYGHTRSAMQMLSDALLAKEVERKNEASANSAETRAVVDEARARGLSVPKWAKPEMKPEVNPSPLAPALAGIVGSLVTGVLAEKTLRGKEKLLPAVDAYEEAHNAAGFFPATESEQAWRTRKGQAAFDALQSGLSEDQKAAQAIAKDLKDLGVATHVGLGGARYELAPNNRVVVGEMDHLSTLAHEAGHATGGMGKKILQKLYMPSKAYGLVGMPLLTFGLHSGMGDTSFKGTAEEKRERLSNAQKLVGASMVPYAPVLAEEARATARGVAMVSRLRGNEEAFKAALRLSPAFATYLAAAAAPIASLAILQRKKNRVKEDKEEMRKAAEEKKEPPITRDLAKVVGAAIGGGSAQHFLPTKMPAFKRGAGVAASIGLAGLAGDRLTRPVLEKNSTAWTPSRIHTLADTLGIPWDNDKHFMDFSEEIIGKRHLDKMTEGELSVLAGALVRICHQAEAPLKKEAADRHERVMAAYREELEKIGWNPLPAVSKLWGAAKATAVTEAAHLGAAGVSDVGGLASHGVARLGAGLKALAPAATPVVRHAAVPSAAQTAFRQAVPGSREAAIAQTAQGGSRAARFLRRTTPGLQGAGRAAYTTGGTPLLARVGTALQTAAPLAGFAV